MNQREFDGTCKALSGMLAAGVDLTPLFQTKLMSDLADFRAQQIHAELSRRERKNAYMLEYSKRCRERDAVSSSELGEVLKRVHATCGSAPGEECATPDGWVEGLPCAVPLEPDHDRGAVADVETALAGPRVPRRSNRWVPSWMRDL